MAVRIDKTDRDGRVITSTLMNLANTAENRRVVDQVRLELLAQKAGPEQPMVFVNWDPKP